jgi:hypothetical protein
MKGLVYKTSLTITVNVILALFFQGSSVQSPPPHIVSRCGWVGGGRILYPHFLLFLTQEVPSVMCH